MKRIILLIAVVLSIYSSLSAQIWYNKLRLSDYGIIGDVSSFTEKQYNAGMEFGEFKISENEFKKVEYIFNKDGYLTKKIIKKEHSDPSVYSYSYTFDEKKRLKQVAYEGPDNSQRTVFYVYDTNNRISEIELCGKDFSTISLAKRKFSSINDFVEIEYNGSGKESEHRVYRNGLQVSEESSKHKIEYTYNTNKQPVYIRRHGIGISNPIMTLLFANPDVADIVEVEEKTHIQYNTKGLIENKKSTVYKKTNSSTEQIQRSTTYQYDITPKGNWCTCIETTSEEGNNIFSTKKTLVYKREFQYFSGEQEKSIEKKNEEEEYVTIGATTSLPDREASFPGGKEELRKYLVKNIQYPTIAQEMGIQGIVCVTVNIDENGYIDKENITVLKSVNPYLDKEVIRIVARMPKWEPAVKDGHFVSQKETLAVPFKLN